MADIFGHEVGTRRRFTLNASVDIPMCISASLWRALRRIMIGKLHANLVYTILPREPLQGIFQDTGSIRGSKSHCLNEPKRFTINDQFCRLLNSNPQGPAMEFHVCSLR